MTITLPNKIAIEKGTFEKGVLLNNLTASGLSVDVNAYGAKRVTLRFVRSAHSAGSSAFTVEATLNGTDYFTYNFLIDHVTNTNAQTLTRVAGKTLNSNSEAVVSMDLENMAILGFRVRVVETTDGTHYAEYVLER